MGNAKPKRWGAVRPSESQHVARRRRRGTPLAAGDTRVHSSKRPTTTAAADRAPSSSGSRDGSGSGVRAIWGGEEGRNKHCLMDGVGGRGRGSSARPGGVFCAGKGCRDQGAASHARSSGPRPLTPCEGTPRARGHGALPANAHALLSAAGWKIELMTEGPPWVFPFSSSSRGEDHQRAALCTNAGFASSSAKRSYSGLRPPTELVHECRCESCEMSGEEKRLRYSSSIGSRGRCCSPCRYASGTSCGAAFSAFIESGRDTFDGGVSGDENGRGERPGSDEDDDDCVYGEGSRYMFSPVSCRFGSGTGPGAPCGYWLVVGGSECAGCLGDSYGWGTGG